MRPRYLELNAQNLVHTSVQDAISSAFHHDIATLKRALQLENRKGTPRIAFVRGIAREIALKECQRASAPKDAA